jgi:hypothetical protein
MPTTTTTTTTATADRRALLKLTVTGPEHEPLPAEDLERLFGSAALGTARLERLARWSRLVALCGAHPVGVVTYQGAAGEVRAPDFGLDVDGACNVDAVVGAMVHGLEVACLAAGARRLVLMPPRGGEHVLRRSGYVAVHEGCAGSWMEKALP